MRQFRVLHPLKAVVAYRFLFGCAVACMLAALLLSPSGAAAAVVPDDTVRAASTFGAGGMLSAAVKHDGTLWCWGYDVTDEESGDHLAGALVPTQVGTDTDWSTASAGMAGILALKGDGSLWSVDVLLGGDSQSVKVVTSRVGTGSDWTAVSAGTFASLALKADGSLWSIAYDLEDVSAGATAASPELVEKRVGGDTDWTAVSSSFLGSVALKDDGSLWTLGMDVEIELGPDLETIEGVSITLIPARLGTGTDWTAIAAGGAHALALRDDGSIWAIGENSDGQLGDGTTSEREELTQVGTATDWVAISAGLTHSLALKEDGSLWAWGCNDDGQLGDGTTTERHSPVRIGSSNDWLAVSGGYGHSFALDAGANLWAWGDNFFAQLGDGTTTSRTAPVKVLTGVKLPAAAQQMTPFSDISASPYRAAIRSLAKRGVLSGFDDGTFRPDQPVSRQQFAKMITLGLGLDVTEGGVPLLFSDVSKPLDSLYPDDYVAVATFNKLIQGYPDGTFRPGLDITRAQLLTIMVRAAQAFEPDLVRTPPPNWVGALLGTDPVHGANIRTAEYSGLTAGIDLAGFAVEGKATRGEIAQLIWNLNHK